MAIQLAHHDRVYHPGAVIVRQNTPAEALYILKTGNAMVVTTLPDGSDVTLDILGAGSMFGEMALVDRTVRSASVIAVQLSACIEIPAHIVDEQLRIGGPLIPIILRVMALRLRVTSHQLAQFRAEQSNDQGSTPLPPDPDTARHLARAVKDLETQVLSWSDYKP